MSNNKSKKVWILEQSDSPLVSTGEKTAEGVAKNPYILSGPCAYFGVKNDNERLYDKDDYLPHLKYLQAQIDEGCLLGSSDHNEDYQVSMKDVSHIIRKLWFDEEKQEVWIEIEIVATKNGNGQDIMALVDKGVPIYISSRATGFMDDDGRVTIDTIYTYDIVYRPGFRRAKLQPITEGLKNYSKNVAIYEWVEPKKKINNDSNEQQNLSEMEEFVTKKEFNTLATNINSNFKKIESLLEGKVPNSTTKKEVVIKSGKTNFINESKKSTKINECAVGEKYTVSAELAGDAGAGSYEVTASDENGVDFKKVEGEGTLHLDMEQVKGITKVEEKLNESLEDITALKNDYVASGYKVFKKTVSEFDNVYDCYYIAKAACAGEGMEKPSGEDCHLLICKFNKDKTIELEMSQDIELENVEVTIDDFLSTLNSTTANQQVIDKFAAVIKNEQTPDYVAPEVFENEEEEGIATANKGEYEYSKEKFDEICEQNKILKQKSNITERLNAVLVKKLNETIERVNFLTENADVANKHIIRLEEGYDITAKTVNSLNENFQESTKSLEKIQENLTKSDKQVELLTENAKISNKHIIRLEEGHDITAEVTNSLVDELETIKKPTEEKPVAKEAGEILETVKRKRTADIVLAAKNQHKFLNNVSESLILEFNSMDDAKKERVSMLIGESKVNDRQFMNALVEINNDADSVFTNSMPKGIKPIWEKLSREDKSSVINLYRYRNVATPDEAELFWESLDLGNNVGRIDESRTTKNNKSSDTENILGYGDEDIKI